MKTNNDELIPCPFCDGEPRTIERPDNITGTKFFFSVACYCGGYSACAHKMAVRETPEQAKRDAIAAWNTRAQNLAPKAAKPETAGELPLSFENAAEAKADREHAEKYYQQAERLLTANERTLHAEIERLKAALMAADGKAGGEVGTWLGDVVEWTENPHKLKPGTKLYITTKPVPAREWVGLTDAEKLALLEHADGSEMSDYEFMDAIESKLREKNTGQPVKEK